MKKENSIVSMQGPKYAPPVVFAMEMILEGILCESGTENVGEIEGEW